MNNATPLFTALAGTGNVGVATSSPTNTLSVVGSLCVSKGFGVGNVACSQTTGSVSAGTLNLGNYDLAELYQTADTGLVAGDIVAVDAQNPLYVARASVSSPPTPASFSAVPTAT